MAYRLGIDIGTNSLGWCLLDLKGDREPAGIRDIGVRLFPDGRDPQSGTSLAMDRRTARGMRRRRDRYLLRRADLMKALIRHGLMPDDEAARKRLETLDPYALRARGLDEALTLHELGRAIFHLNQRRGFRSNRKADRSAESRKESGKIKSGADKLMQAMEKAGARTLGEFLWRRHKDHAPVRTRLGGKGAKAEYEFYPQRAMLEEEFFRLWEAQAGHHPELTPEVRNALHAILFRQRPLRPVDPGKCALDPAADKDDTGGFRAPWALPLAQRFRIYQELANLRVAAPGERERPLTMEERDKIAEHLFRTRKVTFKAMRKPKLLGLSGDGWFNLESPKRDHLKGDETAAALSKKGCFGPRWHELGEDEQSEIVERLLTEQDEDAVVAWLEDTWGLDAEAARAVAAASLPDGYCRLGRRALTRVVAALREATAEFVDPGTGEVRPRPLTYDEAARKAGYHHSDFRSGNILDSLPYYGEALERHVSGTGDPGDPPERRFGRIANPTVHIGLNQTRRIVNALIGKYGHPAEIVVELARELKQSRKKRDEIQKEQAENQRKNEQRVRRLAELGQPDTGENRMRLRLYEELDPLDRRCVYSGDTIGVEKLFGPEVEIDHILPFSRTLDNSVANRILCMRSANRAKTNKSPYEAFGHTAEWPDIVGRAQGLPGNKRWRFAPDALERYEREERDFLDRQLTDTAYLARATKEYLGHICDPDKVWVTPGRLTAMLRGKWGLNSLLSDANLKNRVDHRHHAVDAVVAAVTDRALLQRIATAAGQSGERLFEDMPEPWEGFRDHLRDALRGIVVSLKPEHGVEGKLHEDTAYGLVRNPERENGHNLVYRKPLTELNENEVERIRDPLLRRRLRDHLYEAKGAGKAHKEGLAAFADETGIRRVRLLKKEQAVIGIAGPDGKPYKAYVPGDNHHIEIFERADGKWDGEAVTVFQANRPGHVPAWRRAHPGARLVMRVHKGDMLKLEYGGGEQIMRVVRLAVKAKVFYLAGHREGGNLQARHADAEDPFRWFFASFGKLRDLRARKVSVDVLGRVRDPGPAG